MRETEVVRRLAAACRTCHAPTIEAVLDPGVVAVCDGGGRVPSLVFPVCGSADVARLLHALLTGADLTVENVNGRIGLVLRRTGQALAVIAVTCGENHDMTLWVVLNPAKLRGWHRRGN